MRVKIMPLLCLCAAIAGTFSARAYASQDGSPGTVAPEKESGSREDLGGFGEEAFEKELGGFDEEAFEKELMELLERSREDREGGLGEQGGEDGNVLGDLAQMEKVTNPPLDMRWDSGKEMVVYRLPNQYSFSASVPDGMMTTDPVIFQSGPKGRLDVWLDGMKIKAPEDGVYRGEGNYQIKLVALPNGSESGDNNLYEVDFFFRIIRRRSSEINLVRAPDNFVIHLLEQDGRKMEPENARWHFLGGDGSYRVRFVDEATGGMAFETSFIRDTRAPLLSFQPTPDRHAMTEPVHVDIDDLQAGIEMYYNGEPVSRALNLLETGGYYQYRLKDQAGNERFYAVRMAEQTQLPGLGVIITAFAGVGAAAAWFIHQRRHPRFL